MAKDANLGSLTPKDIKIVIIDPTNIALSDC